MKKAEHDIVLILCVHQIILTHNTSIENIKKEMNELKSVIYKEIRDDIKKISTKIERKMNFDLKSMSLFDPNSKMCNNRFRVQFFNVT